MVAFAKIERFGYLMRDWGIELVHADNHAFDPFGNVHRARAEKARDAARVMLREMHDELTFTDKKPETDKKDNQSKADIAYQIYSNYTEGKLPVDEAFKTIIAML